MGKKYRLSALKEAPVYHPTEDEFADPLRYIASIRAEAEEFGICRIVPPSSFKVPFNQDAASFAFKTRVQTVNELQLRLKKGKNRSFRTEYADFMQSRGQSVTRWPVFGGKKLDLQALYDNVTQRGGFDAVCRAKGWRDMARVMDTPATVTSAAMALRALYQKWLLDFEQHKARQENLSPAGKAHKDVVEALARGDEDGAVRLMTAAVAGGLVIGTALAMGACVMGPSRLQTAGIMAQDSISRGVPSSGGGGGGSEYAGGTGG